MKQISENTSMQLVKDYHLLSGSRITILEELISEKLKS